MKKQMLFVLLTAACLSLAALPLAEGFENASVPPLGWTMIYGAPNHPSGNDMVITTEQAHSGTHSFRFSSVNAASDYNEYLITPRLNVAAGDTTFSFWYNTYLGSETFRVGWSGTDNAISSFTWWAPVLAQLSWVQYVQEHVPVGTQYLAINYASNYWWYLYIDDVEGPELAEVNNADQVAEIPAASLGSNYPNPFATGTSIPYSLKSVGCVNLAVFNLRGQLIKTLVSGASAAGDYVAEWDGTDRYQQPMPNGVYFCKLVHGTQSHIRKMILLR